MEVSQTGRLLGMVVSLPMEGNAVVSGVWSEGFENQFDFGNSKFQMSVGNSVLAKSSFCQKCLKVLEKKPLEGDWEWSI